MKTRLTVVLLLFIAVQLSSCNMVLLKIYGLKSPGPIEEKDVLRYCKKYDIPPADCYQLDTAYMSFLFALDTNYKQAVKNHYQPLQALYYTSGQLSSFQINCYTGGYPNLLWERDSIMTEFPPREQAPLDSIVPLDVQLKYLLPTSATVANQRLDTFDYVTVVHWNRLMGRQSKRFIRTVQKNRQLAGDLRVKVIYVNSDNVMALE